MSNQLNNSITSTRSIKSDLGNVADDESEIYKKNEENLSQLIQEGTIFHEIESSPDDEDPPLYPKIQERDDSSLTDNEDKVSVTDNEDGVSLTDDAQSKDGSFLGNTMEDDVASEVPLTDQFPLTQEEQTEVEDAVKTEIGELEIIIEEQLPTISEEQPRRSTRERKQPNRYIPPVIIKVERKYKKKTVTEPTLVESSQFTQQAVSNFNNISGSQTGSEQTIAGEIIEKKVRLETFKPDDQASSIYSQTELDTFTKCYLCGFDFKDRVSVRHNERWYKDNLKKVTKSYDHTAPVNFSFIVSRIPSQYYILAEYEKPYLKSNGQYACFHCNFTKSQMMFITCPKVGGKVNFDKFDVNPIAIVNFLNKLLESTSEWSIGPDGENTLYKCIENYEGGKEQWAVDRTEAIRASAFEVCTMIKKHVDQTNVAKRFYYTKLLIKKAKELLKEDFYMNDEHKTEKKKKEYAKKFIANFVAKAEGKDPKFVKPWKPFAIGTSPPAPPAVATGVNKLWQRRFANRDQQTGNKKTKNKGGSFHKRKNKNKSKRKTYRRIRLF